MSLPKRLWSRLVTGDGLRKSRLHNYKGERLDLAGLRYLPHSMLTTFARRCFDYRLAIPWIGWRGIRAIDTILAVNGGRTASVLEFGSGMSSLWLAERCRTLVSIEHDEHWHACMAARFAAGRFGHVEYRRHSVEDYPQLPSHPDQSFDFALVDGIRRDDCAREALRKVKAGGYIYLDNSDVTWNDNAVAEAVLLAAAQQGGSFRYFTDFYPGSMAVSQGLLVRLPNKAL